jgi:hypothetical protein
MFTGLAALISAIAGLIGGSVPKMFDLFDKKMNFSQEIKIRELEHGYRMQEHQIALEMHNKSLSAKIEETYYDAIKSEVEQHMATVRQGMELMAKPTGFAVLDFLNSAIRPVFFVSTLALFLVVVMAAVFANPEQFAAQMVTLFSVAVEGVLGWVCGYRAAIKPFAPVER